MVFRSCVLALAVSVVPSFACDTHGSGGDGAPMDGSDGGMSGGDPGDGNVCTIEPAPQGPALLDHANCIHQDTGIVLASCSSTNNLFRACDATFLDWCNAQGGDAIACEEDEIRSTSSICGAGSPFVPCDVWFTDACDGADGVFFCNLYDDGGVCVGGGCEQPPVTISFCCTTGTGGSGTGCIQVNALSECPLDVFVDCPNGATCQPSVMPCVGGGDTCHDCSCNA